MKSLTLALIPALFVMPACHKKAAEPMAQAPIEMPAPPPPAPKRTDAEAVKQMTDHFARVHFELDSDALSTEAKDALSANAEIMNEHPNIRIEVQGHADERGTVDYNIALGQRRAAAVENYLAQVGVSKGRVNIVSYGEEKPVDTRSNTVAWSKNRRCEFRVLTNDPTVEGTVETSTADAQ